MHTDKASMRGFIRGIEQIKSGSPLSHVIVFAYYDKPPRLSYFNFVSFPLTLR